MIKQSDLALAAWKATERTLDAVVTINKIDYKTTDIASISYDAGGYTGDTFGIGSNYENSVTIKFSHLIEGLKPGMTVWPKIGIKTSNGYEYSSLGLFIVSDDIQMDRNNDETTIKAYDQMCLLEGTYTSKLTYPAKMTSVIAEIANLAGVLLNTTDIGRLPVQVDLPSAITGQTYRNAIGMIAQFYAGFVTFDRDGKLTIRTIAEPDYTLDPSQYEQGGLTKNEAPYKIGGIQCEVTTTTTDSTGQSTETTNTLQVGAASGSQIKLTNNLMTMDRLASIWQQLQSLTFYPFSLNWFGNPAIEAGDWLTLQDTKGNKFNVPNNGYTMTFDGSLSAVSKADQTSTSSSSYAWRGELSQYVADLGGRQGASGNYIYGTDTTEPPYGAKFNDIWYKQNGNKVELWTYERQADGTGKWVLTVSDATGEEVKAKVDQVELEAKASTDAAKAASDKADQLAAKYDDTNALANQALGQAVGAQSDASAAVATANSTASEFGKVDQKAGSAVASALNAQSAASDAVSTANSTAADFGKVSQKTDSAVANSLNAQSAASDAVKQASSAAADSKDAKQIAGAVSQSYKTLTDGSTMTIAELESGLAVKLTKTDLDGYATQTWTQNQVKMTADGINGTMSSIKSTVDGQTISINDLKADSSSFKSQFTTVNDTLGKQNTDIGDLQATSKELSSNFSTLKTDNSTNKNDISELKQTSTELNSTMMTVKTQVQNSAVGTNLLKGTGDHAVTNTGKPYVYGYLSNETTDDLLTLFKGLEGQTVTVSVDYEYSGFVAGSYNNRMGWETHIFADSSPYFSAWYYPNNDSGSGRISSTFVVPKNITGTGEGFGYIQLSGSGTGILSHLKLEKGSMATDWCPNPADNASVTAFSKLSQTVDGMKTDISKKIEQSDLNGYATETWTQNQIQVSANGITGTISSIKSTVDGQTTSINDLKADSSSFKSQFTTVNDTLGKQTTDIGSLQATSKELTSGFNTLTSDNTTNKNDISQLKQTSTELSSTMTTVQTQVKNSSVGTNLYRDTRDFDNPDGVWNYFGNWTKTGEIYNGMTVMSFTGAWSGLSQNLDAKKGETYTFSVYARYAAGTGVSCVYTVPNNSTAAVNPSWLSVSLDETWKRISMTFAILTDGRISPRIERTDSNTNTLLIAGPKLERGSVMTDYSTSPLDNATVSALSKLSQTVDGMQLDISKKIEQKDLNGYATQAWTQNQIKITADGINATLSSVKTTVDGHATSINDLKADSSGFKAQFTTVNNTLGKHTIDIGTLQASAKSLSASFDSLNTDNNTNKHDISQLQASAKEFNSTLMTVQQRVTDSSVGTNLLLKTGTPFSMTGRNIVNQAMQIYALSRRLEAGTTVTLSFDIVSTAFANFIIQNNASGDGGTWMEYLHNTADTKKKHYVATITLNGYSQQGIYFRVDNMPSTTTITVSNMKLELGSYASDYSANPADNATVDAVSSISQTVNSIQTTVRGKVDNDTYQTDIKQLSGQITSVVKKADDSWTEIQQNSSNINLKVSKDGIVNAINMSPETTSIFGKKLFITAETYIADAIIKNSMIDNINAEKITAGTLNAAKINVINLNATSITTGTLSGSNLSLNLNTGVVTFQRGRIHNASDSIDINIDAGYMSVANGSNRAMLKNGEMQFVEPGTYDTSNNPYLRISNTFGGQSTEGAAFIGRKYTALTNSDNLTGSGIFDIGMGTETFSGIATGYGSGFLNKGWHMTKVGGAERGVVISGGKSTSYNPSWSASPSIMVGATKTNNSSGGMHGSNIIMECDYLFNYSTWRRTSSHAANVYVADDGAIVRASSASKYKTNIERSFDIGMGERILEVPTAHWFDKAEVRKKTLDPQAPDPRRYFGMIADDLDDAGLTELVEYNDKGEVEGLMYDRIALTIIPIVRNY
ncbi:gp58-like family protein [Lactiplantibacillus plantarum]|uniref:gp58-like family protein n=1 Tax=Lactiplantibacillus plantarum TaxID=1590 RepID=UPI003B009973